MISFDRLELLGEKRALPQALKEQDTAEAEQRSRQEIDRRLATTTLSLAAVLDHEEYCWCNGMRALVW